MALLRNDLKGGGRIKQQDGIKQEDDIKEGTLKVNKGDDLLVHLSSFRQKFECMIKKIKIN